MAPLVFPPSFKVSFLTKYTNAGPIDPQTGRWWANLERGTLGRCFILVIIVNYNVRDVTKKYGSTKRLALTEKNLKAEKSYDVENPGPFMIQTKK